MNEKLEEATKNAFEKLAESLETPDSENLVQALNAYSDVGNMLAEMHQTEKDLSEPNPALMTETQNYEHQETSWTDDVKKSMFNSGKILEYLIGTGMTIALSRPLENRRHEQVYDISKKEAMKMVFDKDLAKFKYARNILNHEFFRMNPDKSMTLGMCMLNHLRTFYNS